MDGASGALVAASLATGTETFAPGGLAWEDGLITHAGSVAAVPSSARSVDAAVIPGFVDCHTHLPFAGWRADEFEARLAGRTYRDLQGGGGGIYRSSRLLAEASDEEVLAFCEPLLSEMLGHGTTAVELKTGYGLSVEAELRQARLARALSQRVAQTCTVTLLACHAVPPGMERADWVRAACEELIPAAASEELAAAVDIYVEDIAFSLDDLEAVAEAAAHAGLPLRVHADQLGASGAAEAAVRLGARSADHLNHLSDEGVEALAGSETPAVLLPASTFFLRADPPPAKRLLESGARIAIASDFNPGTSPTLSMPEVVAMASTLYGLTPADAISAATAGGARVLGLSNRLGTLERGKRADFLVLDAEELAMVPYRFGHNPVAETYVAGVRAAGATSPGPTS
jgi:imidazolonepropionase